MAAMRLGMKTLKLMALSFSLSNDLPRAGEGSGFDYTGHWKRSLTMAVAGRSWARLVGNPNEGEAFLCGLLGRLGQLVMARCLPGPYGEIIDRVEGELPSAELEAKELGYDFHQVGGVLLQSWELPEVISQTVRFWGDPRQVPDAAGEAIRKLSRIMHLADLTSSVIWDSHKGSTFQRLQALALEFYGLSDGEVDLLIASLEEDVAELQAMLNLDVAQESYESIVNQARSEMVQLSLATAIDLEQTYSRAEELEKENDELESLASTDRLTGIPNRAHFDETLARVVSARLSGGSENALGLMMVDVDHFKKFNDTYGHQVGDEVLKLVAQRLVEATRGGDIAARYGGEEFVVIVPNATLEVVRNVAERIRQCIAATSIEHAGQSLSVTVSVGGACLQRIRSQEDGTALLSLADESLYQAKQAGRNRSICREVGTVEVPA
jgi:diguanylate cyclase (GGDEF)-like protein